MSSGLLRCVLDVFITECGVMSSHISNAKQLASNLLEAATKSDDKIQLFDKFSEVLHETLQEASTLDMQYNKIQRTSERKHGRSFILYTLTSSALCGRNS